MTRETLMLACILAVITINATKQMSCRIGDAAGARRLRKFYDTPLLTAALRVAILDVVNARAVLEEGNG